MELNKKYIEKSKLYKLINWLNSFDNCAFEPTRQNVVDKVWELQSELRKELYESK